MNIVYFSSTSENTKRFVDKLQTHALRIPLYAKDEPLQVQEEFILITPTYGGGTLKGAVPKQVIKFLNVETNRTLLRGIISTGNTNFGSAYCLAGEIIAAKCKVPLLYKLELLGTREDVEQVRKIVKETK